MVTCELWLGRMRLFRLGILRPKFRGATITCEASAFCGYPSCSIMNGVSLLFVVTCACAQARMRRYHSEILRSKFPVAIKAFEASGNHFNNQPRPQRAPL
jgi:hypothetical protein